MLSKKTLRKFLFLVLILFVLMNVVAFFHAYKFTHFDEDEGNKTKGPEKLSLTEKIQALIFGVNNPRPVNKGTPSAPFETIKLQSNKLIECWHIKIDSSIGTVILFHGYGGEKSSMLDKADIFRRLGYNTFLVDFMGSGGSEGNQTTIGFEEAEEVITSINYIKEQGENNIILFGTSLGAVAIMKAIHDQNPAVNSIIVECPFGSMLRTAQNRFATMGVPSFPMANLLVFWGGIQNGFNSFDHNPEEYAKKIKCPTLLLRGEKDTKVSLEETNAIFNNLAGYREFLGFPMAGHENYLDKYEKEWTEKVTEFLSNSP